MKWTPEKDQLLLLKILETHSLSVDAKRVAEAWPKSLGPDMPTPRAISERLVRMRNTARESGGENGHFSIGKGLKNGSPMAKSTTNVASSPASVSTPQTLRISNARKGFSLKRKRDDDDDLDEDREEGEYTPTPIKVEGDGGSDTEIEIGLETPSKTVKGKGVSVRSSAQLKKEVIDLESEADVTPVKRVRKASSLAPGMVEWKDEEDDGEGESSASEYVPKGEGEGAGVDSGEEFDDGDLYDA